MRLRLEVELARFAHPPDFHVIRFAGPHRHGFVRHVRNPFEHLAKGPLRRPLLRFQQRDPLPDGAYLLLPLRGVRAFPAQFADFDGLGVAPRLQLLRFGNGGAPPLVQRPVTIQVWRIAAGLQPLGNAVEVRSKPCQIVHLFMLPGRWAADRTPRRGLKTNALSVLESRDTLRALETRPQIYSSSSSTVTGSRSSASKIWRQSRHSRYSTPSRLAMISVRLCSQACCIKQDLGFILMIQNALSRGFPFIFSNLNAG